MKKKRNEKATPEEVLRKSCEEGMGLDLNYNEIRDRLDTTEIARVGKARQAAKTAKAATPAPSAPSPRRAVPAILLVLAVLILTPALAVGSFLIARSTMDPLPPDESPDGTVDSMPPLGTNPDQSFTPNGSVTVTPRPITPNASGEAWNNLFDLSESYTTDNALFLRAEHLDPAMTDGTLPAVLTVNNLAEWQQICSDPTLDVTKIKVDPEDVPGDFFVNHSLLVIVTEGRSGSIRYRLEETYLPIGKLHRSWELVAEVPLALTMDIVHWCIVIPVSKAEAQMPVVLSMRDVYEFNGGYVVEAPDDVITDIIINPYQLWFESDSYARNGCLYGRMGHNGDGSYPYTKTVTTYAEWQSLYLGCSVGSISDGGFTEGLAALDEAFFAEQSLLILYLEEGSGSNRHRVDQVIAEDGTVTVTLTTLEPEIGTCDMAYWAILIPIDKAYSGLPVEIVGKTEKLTP